MPDPALAGAEVALPEPPDPIGAAACSTGGDLPHIVTRCNGKTGLSQSRREDCRADPVDVDAVRCESLSWRREGSCNARRRRGYDGLGDQRTGADHLDRATRD